MRVSSILVWSVVILVSGAVGVIVSLLITVYGLRGIDVVLARMTVPGKTSLRLVPGEYWLFVAGAVLSLLLWRRRSNAAGKGTAIAGMGT